MSLYKPLAQYLSSLYVDRWRAGFSEIERIIGRELPKSARRYPAWWANQNGAGHSQTCGWLDAGWETSELNLNSKEVTFVRIVSTGIPVTANHAAAPTKESKNSEHGPPRRGLTIAEAKVQLSAYYDIPINKIEITMRG